MRVLDLFSGTGSATQPFVDRGHQVYRIEKEEHFDANLYIDVLEIPTERLDHYVPTMDFHFIWASPPCTSYSMGSVSHHWFAYGDCKCGGTTYRDSGEKWACNGCDTPSEPDNLLRTPKSKTARVGRALVLKTIELINELDPPFWVIENPRASLRKMPWMQGFECRTITHCEYGDMRRQKATDLFGVFPPGFEARQCDTGPNSTRKGGVVEIDGVEYRTKVDGTPCHQAAPRGAKTGTQGLSKVEAGMLPYDLGLELCTAVEHALAKEAA